jgi:glycerol-3-phosphate dehydrogenase
MYDFIIIGAGVIGSSVARELSKYQAKTLCLEKENDVANVQSLANSAIIHAGHNPEPGSLKAILSIRGNLLYDDWEKDLHIPLLRTGAFVVAHNKEEESKLEDILETSRKNKVPNYEILSGDQARKIEPNLAKSITKVLSLPSTKVTYPWEVAFACMENAIDNGVEFQKNKLVTNICVIDGGFEIEVNHKEKYRTKNVINATGVDSSNVGAFIEKPPFQIKPRKGEYFVLDKRVEGFMKHVIYPLPSDKGKGVLITPQVHGNILLGPSSEYIDDLHKAKTTDEGLAYIKKYSTALAENIPFHMIIRSFAGIRSTSTYDDFYIKESSENKGFYYLGGIESPGLTAAPAIGPYLVNEVIKVKNNYHLKADFNPYRSQRLEFHRLPWQEKKKLLDEDPLYGRIICKCEKITEKEIIDAIHGPLGSHSIKGIKKRVRAGAGLCQGGYCEEKIMKIIARELDISPLDLEYDDLKSKLFKEETKVKK